MNFKPSAAAGRTPIVLNHVESVDDEDAQSEDDCKQKKAKNKKKKKRREKHEECASTSIDVRSRSQAIVNAIIRHNEGSCEQVELDETSIRQSIREEHEFVRRLINTVPPSVYFDAETLAQYNAQKHARADKKLEVAGVQRTKELSKRAKFQRTKLDPDQQKSVTDIQEELAKQSDDDDSDSDEVKVRSTSDRASSIEELRQRLQNKLASFRGVGKACLDMSEAQEKKRLQRRAQKLQSKEKKQKNKSKESLLKTSPELKLSKKAKEMPPPHAKPVFNKEGKMVFSKFDFSETGMTSADREQRQRKGEFSGKDYKKLLSRVQRDKEKLNELREKDVEKARVVQEKSAWKVALARAEGLKVKTDPDLLKKALKRKEYRKKKTERQWSERTEQVQRRQDAKQKKRRDNIQTRKKDKIKNKIKKAVKRGRAVPGFS